MPVMMGAGWHVSGKVKNEAEHLLSHDNMPSVINNAIKKGYELLHQDEKKNL
jgi:hypothetical protein